MGRPTYYLWKNDFPTEEKLEAEKERFRNLGFRVAVFCDGNKERDIHEGLQAVLRNHCKKEVKA